MGSAVFTHRGELTPDIIARQLEIEAWLQSPWGKMVEEINIREGDLRAGNIPIPMTSSPIKKYFSEFYAQGSDTMIVPQARRITNLGVTGDEELEGKEQNQEVYRHIIYVNQKRNAVNTTIGKMNDLRQRKLAMAQQAKPSLRTWKSEWLTWYMISLAFYEGFSFHITQAAPNGLAKTVHHHPNFWVAGNSGGGSADWVTFHITDATYLGYICEALNTSKDALIAANKFSSEMLEKLKPALYLKKIAPIVTKNGFPFWKIYIHPDVMKQAREDTRIMEATGDAWNSHKLDDPYINGGSLYYNGFVIEEQMLIGTEVHYGDDDADTTFDTIMYGPVSGTSNDNDEASGSLVKLNALENLQSTTAAERELKASLVVGANALSYGQVQRSRFEFEDADYRHKKSVSIEFIGGASRADFDDNIASATLRENTSSAVIVTHSP